MKILVKLSVIFIFTLSLVCLPMYSQSKENGAIEGKVYSEDQALPGVEVTISSPKLMGGTRTTVSNAEGKYRFVALPYGTYAVEAKLEGFQTKRITGIDVKVGKTVSVDFAMVLGRITESIQVTGSALIDVKDSQTAVATLNKQLIEHMPNSQTVAQIVNLAPGVTQDSAFGAHDYGVQYQIDGVDVSDPGLGSAYVFLDYGVVEEAQVMGIGAPAEYGGFTGIVFNTVTKTGSNSLQGMFDSYIQPDKWNASNSDEFTPPAIGYYNGHLSLGGPFIKEKLWFFAAGQYLQRRRVITGYPDPSVYDQPRLFFKLTWQPDVNNRFSMFLHGDLYNGNNRGASIYTTTDATRDQKSPELAFNGSYLHIFSDTTLFEAKFAGFLSYYKLIPHSGYDTPGHLDAVTRMRTVNWITYYHSFRTHIQVNTSLSHHADDFIVGSHDFKFGIEGEYNPNKDEWGYTAGMFYYDYNGQAYYRYSYGDGYSTPSKGMRVSGYVQDSWEISDRIKLNAGVRVGYYRGKLEAPLGTVFKPKVSVAPRVGFTVDLFGDHTTALKAHYGRYYENIVTAKFVTLAPKPDFVVELNGLFYNDWYGGNYTVDDWIEVYRTNFGATTTSMDPDISMPYMDQFTVGLERELFKDMSVGVNFIYRKNTNLIDRVLTNGVFEQKSITYTFDDGTQRNYNVYNQVDTGVENQYLITNPKKGDYGVVMVEPYRKYQGIEFLINKKFSNNWTLLASYIYSKSTGTNDNFWRGIGANGSFNSRMYIDPNPQINSDGRLSIDPTHMVKIQGSVVLPWNINLGFNFSYITGNTYNQVLYVSQELSQSGQQFYADERGSVFRLPAQTNLDLRLQKDFKLGKVRLGILVDVFNLFNSSTIIDKVEEEGPEFGNTLDIVYPRRFRAGVRLYF